ncbi:vacuolar protein sorting-associated protein 16 homolog isoform X2 [Nematostella vectensis]|uniref:vacuolar protein sorting-associated protein 16 homolog isoform X2 n=1 Tax=Nematostella vectensis TaxID=45351 RepID=UPI00207794DB|nr:vacuolar protein sorting-associated protein 16 homolog isoform X2 [Nematostella vectensis]
MAHVTADWTPLGDVFYRKQELYSMTWNLNDVDLSKFGKAASPFGGPIALVRETTQIQVKPLIYIFSSAGKELSKISFDGGRLIHIAWTASEELMCIAVDGSVSLYDIHGTFFRTFTMGHEAQMSQVIECRVFRSSAGTGLAILTGSYHFIVTTNIDNVRCKQFADPPGLNAPPSSWLVLPQDRRADLLVAIDNQLFLINKLDVQQMSVTFSEPVNSITEMALSFNGAYLALFTDSGLLWIGSADLQKVYCEFNAQCTSRPKQLSWCGTGAVICYWSDYLDVIGPTKDVTRYYMDSEVYLVEEPDGVRIIGGDNHEFLQKVPVAVENVFKIGSMEPGAMLFDAAKEFERKSARADEYVRMIKDRLPDAVEQCIQAAAAEYEPAIQRNLLRAASLGNSFLDHKQPRVFVQTCQTLRVLNAVRDFNVGIPLTYAQLELLTLRVLIDRLVLRRHYCLAIRICDYLKIPKAEGTSRILGHWACFKVQQQDSDEEIAHAINAKLCNSTGISYTEIASKALEKGKPELATKLLDYEPKAADQVPLLMKMNKDKVALEKAVQSGDTDLVYMVIMKLKKDLKLGEFLLELSKCPVALNLYMKFCKENNPNDLESIYLMQSQFMDLANMSVRKSINKELNVESKMDCLSDAKMNYTKAGNVIYTKITEEQMKLLDDQSRLEKEQHQEFKNTSLSDTIEKCIELGHLKDAEKLRKDFKVPDVHYHWVKAKALAGSRNWTELEKFSKSRKSPIGYEPFVDFCLQQNHRIEAEKYIAKVQPENKAKYYLKIGKLEEAADAAFNLKDEEGLQLVLKKCDKGKLAQRIHDMLNTLAQKR